MRLPILLFLGFCGFTGHAAPAPADTLRPISPARLLHYTYANDLFFRTDYYFTQGMTLTLVHPMLARLPVRHLLAAGPRGSTQQHGLTLCYDGFTPLRIQDAFIRVGDRPYAAYLYGSFFRASNQPARHQRLTTALEIGFIGPAAGGKQLQTAIHRLTGNAEPRGWDYQIRNAPIIGYRVAFEKQLAANQHVDLLGNVEASLGTLYTYAGTGLRLRAGKLNPCFADLAVTSPSYSGKLHWQLYGEATLTGRLIGYDATLQGSPFTNRDPYTLPASDVVRAILRSSGGVVLAHGGLSFAATATWVSPEFAGGRSHRWGQLGMAVAF
ncbi:lipid A deacylase LpxR family protein [Microvirga sp. STS02]|uniref:lipid A deacylase LpxR family protein n=1 Tax=Hymenobacter negativus TaxID=2795026 RepID=UPI0018DDCBFA|nr:MULTISPECIES: lipid A deacylase LpxR family protein [Bacteria]MBH8570825.1 lipid A deacylase LpxR family protein [Hymenobacter negativus]MBR7210562.1 lipid A deacylase LpxR family protein [Microvirga sp. STS02]